MRTRSNASMWIGGFTVVAATVLSTAPCMASGSTCVQNGAGNREVCVEWSLGSVPIHGTHFQVDYTCTGCSTAPDVELKIGDNQWRVESRGSGGVISDLGNLTAEAAGNYLVKIATNPSEGLPKAGAVNVKSINLNPTGDDHSSLRTDSKISGALQGNLFVKSDSADAGGDVSLRVQGSMTGDIEGFDITDVEVVGNLTGDVLADSVTGLDINGNHVGNLVVDTITSASIGGSLTGNITAKTITSAGINSMAGDIAAPVGSTLDIASLSITNAMSGDITASTVDSIILGPASGSIDIGTLDGGLTLLGDFSGPAINIDQISNSSTSALSQLNVRIDGLQLAPCVFDLKLPINASLCCVNIG